MTLDGRDEGTLRVIAISGSLRKASFNTGLLRAAREIAPDGMEINILDIRDLPFYDGDVEAQGDSAPVVALKSAMREADAVLFATPEYNWGTSGVLKNAIDWASRDREEGSLMGKPVTVIDAGRKGWDCPCPDATSRNPRGNRLGCDGQTWGSYPSLCPWDLRLGREPDRRSHQGGAPRTPG